mgnify:FL=1
MPYKQKISSLLGPNINIDIKRTLSLKLISIKILNNCIKITAPFLLSNKKIEEFLLKKHTWIKKQLLIQSNIQAFIKKEYVNGEEFLFLGETYNLKISVGNQYSIKIEDSFLMVIVKDVQNISKIKRLIRKWLHDQSASYFNKETFYFAEKNKLNLHSVKVREYRARWGSCSTNGDISFNWRLIMAPPHIIEYVIIHELMHIKEHNHSSRFWDLVKSQYPNIKDAKQWLIYNGHTLNI